jgi:hypothetical protein
MILSGARIAPAGTPAAARMRAPAGSAGIDFGSVPRIFSGFLTGEVPYQGALPFICLHATARTGRGTTAAAR